MSIPALKIEYSYPVPTLASKEAIAKTNDKYFINNVYDKYNEYFKTGGIYDTIKGELLKQLKDILGNNSLTLANLDTDTFYTNAQKFTLAGKTLYIDKDHCREGFMAYRFYLKEIATRIKAINESIIAGRAALAELAALTGTAQQINNQAHLYITEIEICDKLIYEELEKFLTYYKFNENTKQWDITTLKAFEKNSSEPYDYVNYGFSQLGKYSDYEKLLWYSWENKQWVLLNDSYEEDNIGYEIKNGVCTKIYEKSTKDGVTTWENPSGYKIKYNNKWEYESEPNSWSDTTESNIESKFPGFTATSDGKIVPKESKPQTPRIQSRLQNLRELQVETTNSLNTNGKGSMQLTSFNSLTLFDRLRYIRWYYKLMFSQTDGVDRTGSRFPDKNDTGYPCMPDIPSVDDTKATQSLGALELFYVGYLINRDGPVNALSSFFEVKVNALRENVSLSSKKIEALNIYLDFINAGLDQLNKNTGHRASDGSIIALTYLCGQKMYNLYEDENGDKYLVLPSLAEGGEGKYFLVKADENGKKWLIGDGTYDPATNAEGNGGCYNNYSDSNGLWHATLATNHGTINTCSEDDTATAYCKYDASSTHTTITIDVFKLPTQLECTTVEPSSVKGYQNATGSNGFKLETTSENNTLGSWTDAFSRKTQYVNTAIDTINTDVTLDRSKIDTFDSLTSTFRSRAQDTYQNIISNIR